MDVCDVLIVGGGPSGSSCAWNLRRAGLDVVVMDKKMFPRNKVCAGWVTPAVVGVLEIDTQEYNRGRVLQPIHGFRSSVLGRKEIEILYNEVVSYGILRYEFDDYLLRRCNARLRLGEEIKTIVRNGTFWRVNESIDARLVIGAGGHFCPIARLLGARAAGTETVVTAQELEFEINENQLNTCKIKPEVPELFFCEDLLGYAWCFRKGAFLNIGLGREDRKSLSDHTRKFLSFLKTTGKIPLDTPESFHGHAYILYGHTQREILGDGMMLIGDAAGLAYPESGEGIRTAVESGLLAAETVVSCKGNFSQENLEPYRQRLIERFGRPAPSNPPIGFKKFLARTLLGTHWFSRHILMNRWFLHQHQPSLTKH